jgi:hypothetical protein
MISIILLIYLFLLCALLGDKLFFWTRTEVEGFLEKSLFAVGLGLGVFACSTCFLGKLGVLYPSVLWAFVAASPRCLLA